MNLIQNRNAIYIFIILSLMCSSSAAFQSAGDAITFSSIPEKLEIKSGESVNFDVILTNRGSMYGDINLEFRNLPDGITVVGGKKYQLMDVKKSVTYHVVLESNERIKAGTYSFEIADNSDVDVRTWEPITLIVYGTIDTTTAEPRVVVEEGIDKTKTPAFMLIQLLAVLLIISIVIGIGKRKHEAK